MAKGFTIIINKLVISRILITCAVLLIAAFQYYWVARLFAEERENLCKEADVVFRDALYKLQLARFKNGNPVFMTGGDLPDNLFLFDLIDSVKAKIADSLLQAKLTGPGRANIAVSINKREGFVAPDSVRRNIQTLQIQIPDDTGAAPRRFVHFFSSTTSVPDTLMMYKIDSAYKQELLKNNIQIPFTLRRIAASQQHKPDSVNPGDIKTSISFVGLSRTYAYQASFGNPLGYLFNKIKLPAIVSAMLVAFTITCFVFVYRNLVEQQKLAVIKNEFIGNITHELKTPIATVTVAVEALRNFNALQNPERTKEYLDISALELQRLALLVDKVLKLSMFENKQIELKKENVDMLQLAAEVIAGMKLQLEKAGAAIQLTKQGDDFLVVADRLHIAGVLYNLLDNAIKYSAGKPFITIHLQEQGKMLFLSVTDNGIGIPAAYADKIFQKFFRVPVGGHHNIKGYGLGLSYAQHIVTGHYGGITVSSVEGKGSTFTIKLPKL